MDKLNFAYSERKQQINIAKVIFTLIVWFVFIRLISLGLYPLYDTTEARYGEIARIMFETQDWVTPAFDYQVPFWGKPPLHTWLSAFSFQMLGVSEFSARLPHFIMAVFTVFILYRFARRYYSSAIAQTSALILLSSIGYIIAAGMVMTDAVLTFSVTLTMTSFWQNYSEQASYRFGIVFFIAMAIGMLVKGPVAIVIIGIALLSWSVINGCFCKAIKSLPWLSGLLCFSLITVPWYILAELATPGFLEYFLWGEHIQRFLQPGWQGDLYGTAHDEIKGTIWLFGLAMAFPWSFIALYFTFKKCYQAVTKQVGLFSDDIGGNNSNDYVNNNAVSNYLLAWLLAPLLLFTLAGNILPAYVMPALPAFALWLAPKCKSMCLVIVTAVMSLLLVIAAIIYVGAGFTSKTSQQALINDKVMTEPLALYYWQKRPFSGQFYSKGKAKLLTSEQEVKHILNANKGFYLALPNAEINNMTTSFFDRCLLRKSSRKYSIYRCN